MNETEANITVEEPGSQYGLQLVPLHSIVDEDDIEWGDIVQFEVSSDESTVWSAPYPASASTVTTSGIPAGDWSSTDGTDYHGSTSTTVKVLPQTLTETSPDRYMVVYIVLPLACLLFVFMACMAMLHKRRKRLMIETSPSNYNNREDRYNSMRLPNGLRRRRHPPSEAPLPMVPDKWELPRISLHTGPILGSGAFGHVVKGSLDRSALLQHQLQHPGCLQTDQSNQQVIVAIKMLQEDTEDVYHQDFIKEINLMKNIGFHPNVVGMLGCCTLTEPLCLVVEHVPNGDLLNHLRDVRLKLQEAQRHSAEYENMRPIQLTTLDLLSYARQITVGMEFLSQKGYVHRDLAARNVLVGEGKSLKIGDFGLARYVYDDQVYVNRKGGKLPIKWMSIEAIFDLTFSTASDVWSFGVVLFEICTLGGTPYPTLDNKELLKELRKGWRMEKPESCSQELYELMLSCWRDQPISRPSFTELRHSLESMIEQNAEVNYMDLCLSADQDYYIQDSTGLQTGEGDQSGMETGEQLDQEQKGAGLTLTNSDMTLVSFARPEGVCRHLQGQCGDDTVHCAPVEIVCTTTGLEEACDDVFDGIATKSDLCGCPHGKKTNAFNFEEFCNKCGKIRSQFQERMAKLLPASLCHPSRHHHHLPDITDNSSPGSDDFMLQSGCCRGDRIQSDLSSSTCSSGECLIMPVDNHQKSPTPSGGSEMSVSSTSFLLPTQDHGRNSIDILIETQL